MSSMPSLEQCRRLQSVPDKGFRRGIRYRFVLVKISFEGQTCVWLCVWLKFGCFDDKCFCLSYAGQFYTVLVLVSCCVVACRMLLRECFYNEIYTYLLILLLKVLCFENSR
jgi:hypothetical protein